MKFTRGQWAEHGYPVDYKIGGLTITCRGEMTPLRKKILAAQIADERKGLSGFYQSQYGTWYANKSTPAERAKDRYLAWCKENGKEPRLDWQPSLIITNGASIIELRGDAANRADRWLALCKKAPPQDGTPPPLPEVRADGDLTQDGYNGDGP